MWTMLLVATALLTGLGARTPGEVALLSHGGLPTLAAPATLRQALPIPTLPVPPLPVPPAPVPAPLGRPLPVAPAPLSPLPPPALPLPALPLPALPVPALPVPSLPVPGVPALPVPVPLPPGVLQLPSLAGLPLASAGALPIADGPTDTRPGKGPSFTLEARRATLNGVRFRGVTSPPGRKTDRGERVVRIDVDSAQVTAPILRARHADGGVMDVRSEQVASLTGRGQIYIEEFTGTLNVAGQPTVPIRIDADSVSTPGVDLGFLELPSLTFTDVTARVAFLQAGRLTIPAMTVRATS